MWNELTGTLALTVFGLAALIFGYTNRKKDGFVSIGGYIMAFVVFGWMYWG